MCTSWYACEEYAPCVDWNHAYPIEILHMFGAECCVLRFVDIDIGSTFEHWYPSCFIYDYDDYYDSKLQLISGLYVYILYIIYCIYIWACTHSYCLFDVRFIFTSVHWCIEKVTPILATRGSAFSIYCY